MKKQLLRFVTLVLFITISFSACSPQGTVTSQPATSEPTSTVTSLPIISTSTAISLQSHIGDAVPLDLRAQIQSLRLKDFTLDLAPFVPSNPSLNETKIQWVYALVAPFPTVTDGFTFDQVHTAWIEGTAPDPFNGIPLLMDESTLKVFTAQWDAPAPNAVQVVSPDKLLDEAWTESAWAIIPFESLEPKWKVLTIDGQSPIHKTFDVARYPLVVDFTLQSSIDAQSSITNYDPSKLTTIIMTGVTALVRATAVTMEYKGVTYPGEKIRDVMRKADIAHVSNEIPFFTGCQFPKPDATGPLVFCSDPKYIDLLTDVGTDVVELTGNHFADRGAAGMIETIKIYNDNGLPYFGGGLNLQDSLKPALIESNGNKIAFIGCNKPDIDLFDTARDYRPGAAPCDFSYLTKEIAELKLQGYVVVSTFQWNESYDWNPNPQQLADFRLMADSGASIVSGSQAHYAQKMEFYDGSFIHYGLGNLFFDQMGDLDWMPPGIRREFLDRYVIYDGKFISAELVTAVLEDYARPRLMNAQERSEFLAEYFFRSGWTAEEPVVIPTVTPTLTPLSIPSVAGTPQP